MLRITVCHWVRYHMYTPKRRGNKLQVAKFFLVHSFVRHICLPLPYPARPIMGAVLWSVW